MKSEVKSQKRLKQEKRDKYAEQRFVRICVCILAVLMIYFPAIALHLICVSVCICTVYLQQTRRREASGADAAEADYVWADSVGSDICGLRGPYEPPR